MTIIGFTGTQQGMTYRQFQTFCRVYKELSPEEFHHGDDIGSDREAHDVVRTHGSRIVVHPPEDSSRRAFCKGDEIRPPKPYLERNKDIVADVEYMIATPRQFVEVRRSGTWATIRYTRKATKEIFIIYPDGSIDYEVTTCAVCDLPRRYCVCVFPFLRIDTKTGENVSGPQGEAFSPGKRKSRKIKAQEIGVIVGGGEAK